MNDLSDADSKQTLASVSKNCFPFDLGKSNIRLQEKSIIYSFYHQAAVTSNRQRPCSRVGHCIYLMMAVFAPMN